VRTGIRSGQLEIDNACNANDPASSATRTLPPRGMGWPGREHPWAGLEGQNIHYPFTCYASLLLAVLMDGPPSVPWLAMGPTETLGHELAAVHLAPTYPFWGAAGRQTRVGPGARPLRE
jgi:hypothetical protein